MISPRTMKMYSNNGFYFHARTVNREREMNLKNSEQKQAKKMLNQKRTNERTFSKQGKTFADID